MHDLFLPYQVSFDPDSSTYCCTGTDRDGEVFGAGSGVTPEVARRRLRETVLESLATDASDGNDFTPGFVRTPKGESCLTFTTLDLLPIRIRLARSARRLEQAEVAARMGISQQAYAKLERPGGNPTLGLLDRLEKALQKEILQLT